MAKRVCSTSGCPTLVDSGACAKCRAVADRARGSAAQRGYDRQHRNEREAALPEAYFTPCPRCDEPMLPGQALDWGHSKDRALFPDAKADRVEHARCNQSAGAALGNRLRTDR